MIKSSQVTFLVTKIDIKSSPPIQWLVCTGEQELCLPLVAFHSTGYSKVYGKTKRQPQVFTRVVSSHIIRSLSNHPDDLVIDEFIMCTCSDLTAYRIDHSCLESNPHVILMIWHWSDYLTLVHMGQFAEFGLNGFKQGQTHFSKLLIFLDLD